MIVILPLSCGSLWKWGLFLTHWGRVTHICVGYLTIIGSDNGLLPGRRQAIIWINAGILLIGPLGINFSEILIKIKKISFKKMHLKVSSAKRRPFCLGLNVLMEHICDAGPRWINFICYPKSTHSWRQCTTQDFMQIYILCILKIYFQTCENFDIVNVA